MTGSDAAPQIDTSRPHPARVYDWWLGGKDNYPVDEELARKILAADGTAVRGARANRRFMHRAVRAAAEDLANTPAICRRSYVNGTVVAAFEEGVLERFSRMLKSCRSPSRRAQVLARVMARAAA